MKNIIVIPVYKNPDADELLSLRRCCQVLSRYEMSLVCPKNLDTSAFHALWDEYGLVLREDRFDAKFFKDIAGYNRLLLSENFYVRFAEYDYMLIYQPDAYVFEDRLEYWCMKGYDYIGAPVLWNYPNYLSCGWVGNGGLSLRRISAFLNYFKGSQKVIPLTNISTYINFKKKPYTRWILWILIALGWHNRPKSFAKRYKYNEDVFWCRELSNTIYEMTTPSIREAMEFAYERFPQELYSITGHLPFGAHAWKKYEYNEFWKEIIQ